MRLWCAVVFVLFQSVKEEHMGEIIFISVCCQITCQPALIPIGSLDEFLIPIGTLSQLQNEFLA